MFSLGFGVISLKSFGGCGIPDSISPLPYIPLVPDLWSVERTAQISGKNCSDPGEESKLIRESQDVN